MSKDLISQMHNELLLKKDGYVGRFDGLLEKFAQQKNSELISQLISFFDDEEEYDELWFSIVHTIENCEHEFYDQQIIRNFEPFFANSPRWAVIVLMRILNSPESYIAFLNCMKNQSQLNKPVLRKALEVVRKKDARFESKCVLLFSML